MTAARWVLAIASNSALAAVACSSGDTTSGVVDAGARDAAIATDSAVSSKRSEGSVPDAHAIVVDAAQCPVRPEPRAGAVNEYDGSAFGCHESRELAPDGWWGGGALEDCRGGAACTYDPGDLPCGSCNNEGFACAMVAWAACDCGGRRFVDPNEDAWVCKCQDGNWRCLIVAPSDEACSACVSSDAGPM